MDQGSDLDYAVIHIPSCHMEIETELIEAELSVRPNVRITLDDITKYVYRTEGDPFKDLTPFDKFEAIVMFRTTHR